VADAAAAAAAAEEEPSCEGELNFADQADDACGAAASSCFEEGLLGMPVAAIDIGCEVGACCPSASERH